MRHIEGKLPLWKGPDVKSLLIGVGAEKRVCCYTSKLLIKELLSLRESQGRTSWKKKSVRNFCSVSILHGEYIYIFKFHTVAN